MTSLTTADNRNASISPKWVSEESPRKVVRSSIGDIETSMRLNMGGLRQKNWHWQSDPADDLISQVSRTCGVDRMTAMRIQWVIWRILYRSSLMDVYHCSGGNCWHHMPWNVSRWRLCGARGGLSEGWEPVPRLSRTTCIGPALDGMVEVTQLMLLFSGHLSVKDHGGLKSSHPRWGCLKNYEENVVHTLAFPLKLGIQELFEAIQFDLRELLYVLGLIISDCNFYMWSRTHLTIMDGKPLKHLFRTWRSKVTV